jgi:hypothetical protein
MNKAVLESAVVDASAVINFALVLKGSLGK